MSVIASGAPPWEWSNNPPGDAPYTYQVPGSLLVEPYTSTATYDGTDASADFIPVLTLYSQSGAILARVFPAATIKQGDSAVVTYVPPFGSAASSSGGGGSPLEVTDGLTAVNDVTEIDFTSGATVTDGGGGTAQVAVNAAGVTEITSTDGSVTVTDPFGPITDLSVPGLPAARLDYVEETSWTGTGLAITAASRPTAQTVITGNAITLAATTIVKVEVYIPIVSSSGSGGCDFSLWLDGNDERKIAELIATAAGGAEFCLYAASFFSLPAGTHTFLVKAWNQGNTVALFGGPGAGATDVAPAWYQVSHA